jgi:multiple sugar transport system ATP-binding protein
LPGSRVSGDTWLADPDAGPAAVRLDRLSKRYGNGFQALQELTLEIADGEFMVLVGPSGCGKTTALRMVAGLEEITEGTVWISGNAANHTSPKDRDVAMVFQNYALYPHMTVAQNIGFPLRLRGVQRTEISRRITDAAEILGLTEALGRRPAQLSGGQRQRVAMGRAIVREPSVFLMDEPLSNLDAKLRVQMRADVRRIQRRLGVATIYVTHDQTEAMTMGDRVAVMHEGRLLQCDRPSVLYEHPANVFVAGFIGSAAMNLYEATLGQDAGYVTIGSQTVSLPDSLRLERPALAGYATKPVVVGIRPEHLSLPDKMGDPGIVGEVELVESLGGELLVHFSLDAARIEVERSATTASEGGDELVGRLSPFGEGIARVDSRCVIDVGDRIRFALDASRMQFFDPVDQRAIRD